MVLSLFPFAIPFTYKNVVSATNYKTTRYISRLLTFPWGVVLRENWVIGGAYTGIDLIGKRTVGQEIFCLLLLVTIFP